MTLHKHFLIFNNQSITSRYQSNQPLDGFSKMQPVIVSVAELEDFTRKTASNRYNEKFLTPSTSTKTTD